MITVSPVEYLKSKGVNYLYHFTELSNLNSIIKYGLLSRDELERRRQKFHDGAFSHVIEKRASVGISNYVPFNLCSKVPMLFITEGVKKKSCRVLKLFPFITSFVFLDIFSQPKQPMPNTKYGFRLEFSPERLFNLYGGQILKNGHF